MQGCMYASSGSLRTSVGVEEAAIKDASKFTNSQAKKREFLHVVVAAVLHDPDSRVGAVNRHKPGQLASGEGTADVKHQ